MTNMPDYFNDDAEIISRLEECERFTTAWRKLPSHPTSCAALELMQERITELRRALVTHIMAP